MTVEMNEDGYPEGAEECLRCDTMAIVLMDGRKICLSCGAVAKWIEVKDRKPDGKEPVVYARRKPGKSGWFVGIAYWTVSDRYNPEMESSYAPGGFTHWMPLPEIAPGEMFEYPEPPTG